MYGSGRWIPASVGLYQGAGPRRGEQGAGQTTCLVGDDWRGHQLMYDGHGDADCCVRGERNIRTLPTPCYTDAAPSTSCRLPTDRKWFTRNLTCCICSKS